MKQYKFIINGNQYVVEIKGFNNNLAELEVNGTPFKVEVEHQVTLTKTPKISRPTPKPAAAPAAPVSGNATPVLSPLPGTILKINVKLGDAVQKGDKLFVMEAMKMENNIQAEKDGVVKSIRVAVGDNVLQGALIMEME
ncbi:MAG TPA: biotin/lipoyl-binding protein [Bacteroidales bacterium]|nr:biotin/lipoyl-binding protein [Bacteroidales bacterium]HRZ48011.1 biotin/lipoyl-binding protein [Bacteroidales bacterium]